MIISFQKIIPLPTVHEKLYDAEVLWYANLSIGGGALKKHYIQNRNRFRFETRPSIQNG